MFEGVVASLFNRYLGKYVEDLDLENLNVGIFSGNVVLENLKLKPEALYELGLPIVVKVGTIGKLSLNIPWNRLCNQTSVITIEEVFILACPVTIGKYQPDVEKRLLRAEKRRALDKLDANLSSPLSNGCSPDNFTETLVTSILNNLKIYIHNVHIRYEDTYTDINMPISFGLCLHNFSVETTNSKWKPISHGSKLGSVYQVVKLESFSIYCNVNSTEILLNNETMMSGPNNNWINCMRRSLETFSIFGEALDFIVKPISVRIKIIINKSNEARIPKLLVDFVLQDAALQLSHQQYLALVQLSKSFARISVNRLYRKFHPQVPVAKNAKKWWKYAYDCVVSERIEPYTWPHLFSHRKNYRSYCHIYRSLLTDPSDTEIKIDLQRAEDMLDICNIIIAREHTKMQFRKDFPDKIVLKEQPSTWWKWNSDHPDQKRYKLSMSDKKNSFWNLLSQNEKNSLCEMIGFNETEIAPDKPKQYIERKFNFTIANLNLSLVSGGSETLVIAMSHLLSSIETRPSAKAYKITARVESLVIEGASVEYSLIPILTSENVLNGNHSGNFLIVDFEKNPLNSDVDYLLSITSESLEIVYHEFSMSSFASFLQTPTLSMESATATIWSEFKRIVNSMASGTVSRRCIFQVNVDMKLPHFIIPEYGSLQKNGKIIIFDMGRLKIWSDLQLPDNSLEDATQLELEEKLYDRFYFSLVDFQILMFDNGNPSSTIFDFCDQEWRNFKKIHTSQYHILSKIHSQIVFSNSIKPESKQLPRYKLNVSLQKLKINMSDSRIVSLINFINNVPSPKSHTVLHLSEQFSYDNVKLQDRLNVLERIQHLIACSELRTQLLNTHMNKEEMKKSFLTVEKSGLSSEVSDEDSEIWARILDLPGFDDNVSQNNVIIYLFRINIVQIIIELKRSSSSVDKPYIILHLVNFCCDTAFMEYGPAVQVSLGSISIVDKLHCSVNSNQTQILSTNGKPDVISILYRKVRSDCPDFKSHFHSVEQSLVIEINTVHVVFHKEAFVDLYRYLQYFSNKFKNRSITNTSVWVRDTVKELYKQRLKTPDPPIPAGATKFSYSTRISDVKFQLCDTEIDFLLIRVAGFELDCMFKTDERLIFRAYLMTFTIDDISNTSLYPKILSVEEEKLMEMKYVRRSRRLSKTNIETNADDIKSDGVFKFHFSRIHVVIMFKLIYDLQKFFSPFVPAKCFRKVGNFVEKSIERFLASLRFSTDKIHVSVDFQLPTFLLPQQASSPNLIIFNAGDLTVENFFKELATEEENKTPPVIDNALIKLDSVIISRAIVNFNGSIIVQETIMGPVCCKTDTKRLLLSNTAVNEYDSLSMFDINTTIDMITINLGQKDFSTLNLIWLDSVLKILAFWNLPKDKLVNSCANEEVNVRKLEAFFYQVESNRKQVTLHVNFEGLLLCLYNDIDEVLSSPVRDENRSLCKFKIGETAISGVIYANGKTDHQLSVQSLLLEDTRVNNTACIKRIFQSYGATYTQSNNENVCITVPPVISIMLNKNQLGESHCNVLIDHTRLNLGVSFLMELFRFFIEATPFDQDNAAAPTTTQAPVPNNTGVINYGYSENCEAKNGSNLNHRRTSNDPGDDSGGLSLSITCRKPEIMLFSQLEDYGKSHALLLRADLSIEYVRHPTNVSFTFNISDLHMLSKLQSTLIKTSSNVVLQPCNIEISKNWAAVNEETKISISCDKVNLHVSASTVHTILNIIREVDSYFFAEPTMNKCETPDNFYQDCDDLWSAKKITPYCLPQKQETTSEQLPTYVISEIMILSIPSVKIMFEIEDVVQKKPVLLLKLRAEAKLKNWSNSLEMKGDISMQCSYYNFKVNAWEPILEPCVKTENIYRPWEITIKAFKSKSYPISIILSHNKTHRNSISKKKTSVSSTKESVRSNLDSETSAGEDDCGSIRSVKKTKMHADRTERNFTDSGTDSENEDTVMEKLKTRFGQLLIGESSDENTDTDSDISLNEQSFNNNSDDNTDEDTISHLTNNSFLLEKRAVFITKQRESDTGLESANYDKSATYIILETQERFEMVITPSTMSVIKQILESFSLKFNNILTTDTQILSLKNDIAPHSTVILRSKSTVGPMKILMCANYSLSESSPSSPGSTIGSPCNVESPTDLEFQSGIENFEGGFASDAYSKTDAAKRKSDGDILLNALQFPRMSVDILYAKVMDRQLYVTVNGFEDLTVICPTKTTNKYHALQPVKNNTRYYVVVSVQNDLWGQSITVRSPLQMKNETCFPLALYYKKNALDNTGFDHIGELTNPFEDSFKFAILEPDEVYNMPLMITYHCAVYVLPIYEEYHLSETGLWWKELANDISTPKDVICQPKNEKSPVFAIRAITSEGVHFSNPCSRTLPNFMIRLIPSVFVFNLLPCAFQIKIPSAEFNIRIEAGGKASIYSLDMNTRHAVSFEVPMYFGISWTGTFHLYNKMEEKTLSMTTDQDTDGGNKHLTLNVRVDKAESYNVMVYSPYWIVNKTGLPLQLKGSSSDVVYETLVEEPLFFAFRKTQKRNIRLRVYQSSWSSAFSIDTAGCSGLITCRDRERNRSYYILVEITLSQLNPQLTKIVTLLPYFLISNESKFAIRYMEENEQADLWIDLPQNQTIPFWPETNTMKMYIKYRDSSLVSQHFYINQACQTVLRMDKESAIVVDIVGGDNKPFLIAFQDYKIGDAPVRIDNFCEDLFLKISQENSGQVTLLSPYQSLLYTWDDPTLERKLQWNVYNRKNKGFMANFKTDGYGQEYVSFKLIKQQTLSNSIKTNKLSSSLKKFTSKYTAESSSSGEESERDDSTDVSQMIKTHKGKVVVYWVSYLEGSQRVLLFTQDEQVAFYAYSRIDSERSNVELFLSIKGIGLSLVTEQKNVSRELAYISVNDSASIWEVNIAHSWKILPLELATWLEHQWSQGIKKAQLKDYVNVDLDKMQLIKPFFGELKRTYQPAFWLHCRKSFNYYYFQWKVHKFQVDNQLPNSVFQSVIYPKIVSYDVIRKYGLKPCLEGTFIKKRSTDYERDVYKYIKFMALEFCVQVDKQFVLSVHELIQPWSRSESSSLRIRADICKVHHPLVIKFHNNYKNLKKTVVEYLYFSPIKIQFSFTSQNVQHLQTNFSNQTYVKACLHYILNCISCGYVDFKGVKLKCPYFEESGNVTHVPSKLREIRYHYFHNLIRQMYSHILGPDSACNANNEVDLCEEYVEFYYDLSLAFLKKVDEFAEAISEAARCLLSHITTSSVNSTSSLIMCGKRISLDLGLNPEIIKKKSITQQISFEEPEEVLRGDSCFEIGVLYGLSGVFMNIPICNQQEGIELFFRTAGKHLLRLLNKYSNTISSMPVTAIDGIKRAAETGTDITFRRRLPKYINPFGMKPFSVHHAIGLNILHSINKGIYAETDDYWTHVILTNDGRSCLLITLQRIFLISKVRMWDDWKIEWCIGVNDIIEVPQVIDSKLLFKIRQEESVHNLYTDDKLIEHEDVNLLFWMQKMIEIVFIINLENKPCFFVESQVLRK